MGKAEMKQYDFELKLSDGQVVTWQGKDGIDAATRYVDCKGGTVIAWRDIPVGIFPYNGNAIE